ncbi:MAG TPA: glycoside hydrolase family 2 TIM barrel-domain containing protein [Bacteroidales bacterium]|nr:glycoside hydrolase family 2 TIM barrel-domain containing protein [Bacteroidales bacterium]
MFRSMHVIQVSFFLVFALAACSDNGSKNSVSFSGRQLLVNSHPYLIKGICYHPVSKGTNHRSFENLSADLALMKEAGINTIRVYSPVNDRTVLDKIHHAGIRLIVGFGYNQNGYFDILSGSFAEYIKTYKNHPAMLFWEFGNEYNYHPEWFEGDIRNWYLALEKAAQITHSIDPDHPVSTAHGELPDSLALAMCPEIDIWGMNVYRWDNPAEIFREWEKRSEKPMYLSEAGADSYMTVSAKGYEKGVNEIAQADATQNILKIIFQNKRICSGTTLFAFSDEWWKAGNNETQDAGGWAPGTSGVPYDGAANEEYWGIVDIDRNKKIVFGTVRDFYKGNQ